jgi:hypothetical protein
MYPQDGNPTRGQVTAWDVAGLNDMATRADQIGQAVRAIAGTLRDTIHGLDWSSDAKDAADDRARKEYNEFCAVASAYEEIGKAASGGAYALGGSIGKIKDIIAGNPNARIDDDQPWTVHLPNPNDAETLSDRLHAIAVSMAGDDRTYSGKLAEAGRDLAEFTPPSAVYNSLGFPLYGPSGKPVPGDIYQGDTGDCFFEAAEAALAGSSPQDIQNAIKPDGNGGYVVTVYNDRGEKMDVPVSAQDIQDVLAHHPANQTVLWPVVMEAAEARVQGGVQSDGYLGNVNDGLGHMNNGDFPGAGLDELTGHSTTHWNGMSSGSDITDALNAVNAGKPVVMGTNRSATPIGWDPHRDGLSSAHAYNVISMHQDPDGTVWAEVDNPWGYNLTHGDSGDWAPPADANTPGSRWLNVTQANKDGAIVGFSVGNK